MAKDIQSKPENEGKGGANAQSENRNKITKTFGLPFTLQPKLEDQEAADPYEKEADSAGEAVSRGMKVDFISGGVASHLNKEELQPKLEDEGATDRGLTSLPGNTGSGMPMDAGTMGYMGHLFGQNFEAVRIHNTPDADRMSRGLNAKAFTVGNDIYFKQGNYDPETSEGKNLLGHELAHTVQQGKSGPSIQRKEEEDGHFFNFVETDVLGIPVKINLQYQSSTNAAKVQWIFNYSNYSFNKSFGTLIPDRKSLVIDIIDGLSEDEGKSLEEGGMENLEVSSVLEDPVSNSDNETGYQYQKLFIGTADKPYIFEFHIQLGRRWIDPQKNERPPEAFWLDIWTGDYHKEVISKYSGLELDAVDISIKRIRFFGTRQVAELPSMTTGNYDYDSDMEVDILESKVDPRVDLDSFLQLHSILSNMLTDESRELQDDMLKGFTARFHPEKGARIYSKEDEAVIRDCLDLTRRLFTGIGDYQKYDAVRNYIGAKAAGNSSVEGFIESFILGISASISNDKSTRKSLIYKGLRYLRTFKRGIIHQALQWDSGVESELSQQITDVLTGIESIRSNFLSETGKPITYKDYVGIGIKHAKGAPKFLIKRLNWLRMRRENGHFIDDIEFSHPFVVCYGILARSLGSLHVDSIAQILDYYGYIGSANGANREYRVIKAKADSLYPLVMNLSNISLDGDINLESSNKYEKFAQDLDRITEVSGQIFGLISDQDYLKSLNVCTKNMEHDKWFYGWVKFWSVTALSALIGGSLAVFAGKLAMSSVFVSGRTIISNAVRGGKFVKNLQRFSRGVGIVTEATVQTYVDRQLNEWFYGRNDNSFLGDYATNLIGYGSFHWASHRASKLKVSASRRLAYTVGIDTMTGTFGEEVRSLIDKGELLGPQEFLQTLMLNAVMTVAISSATGVVYNDEVNKYLNDLNTAWEFLNDPIIQRKLNYAQQARTRANSALSKVPSSDLGASAFKREGDPRNSSQNRDANESKSEFLDGFEAMSRHYLEILEYLGSHQGKLDAMKDPIARVLLGPRLKVVKGYIRGALSDMEISKNLVNASKGVPTAGIFYRNGKFYAEPKYLDRIQEYFNSVGGSNVKVQKRGDGFAVQFLSPDGSFDEIHFGSWVSELYSSNKLSGIIGDTDISKATPSQKRRAWQELKKEVDALSEEDLVFKGLEDEWANTGITDDADKFDRLLHFESANAHLGVSLTELLKGYDLSVIVNQMDGSHAQKLTLLKQLLSNYPDKYEGLLLRITQLEGESKKPREILSIILAESPNQELLRFLTVVQFVHTEMLPMGDIQPGSIQRSLNGEEYKLFWDLKYRWDTFGVISNSKKVNFLGLREKYKLFFSYYMELKAMVDSHNPTTGTIVHEGRTMEISRAMYARYQELLESAENAILYSSSKKDWFDSYTRQFSMYYNQLTLKLDLIHSLPAGNVVAEMGAINFAHGHFSISLKGKTESSNFFGVSGFRPPIDEEFNSMYDRGELEFLSRYFPDPDQPLNILEALDFAGFDMLYERVNEGRRGFNFVALNDTESKAGALFISRVEKLLGHPVISGYIYPEIEGHFVISSLMSACVDCQKLLSYLQQMFPNVDFEMENAIKF